MYTSTKKYNKCIGWTIYNTVILLTGVDFFIGGLGGWGGGWELYGLPVPVLLKVSTQYSVVDLCLGLSGCRCVNDAVNKMYRLQKKSPQTWEIYLIIVFGTCISKLSIDLADSIYITDLFLCVSQLSYTDHGLSDHFWRAGHFGLYCGE